MTWGTGNWPGTGTSGDPYQVPNAEALDEVRNNSVADSYYILTADISLIDYQTGAGWTPITPSTQGIKIYFDGYKVTNLLIDNSSLDKAGLFGTFDGEAYDIKIEGADITARDQVGIFAGRSDSATVTGYRIGTLGTACTIGGVQYMGSLIGYTAGDVATTTGFANVDITATNGYVCGLGFVNVGAYSRSIKKGIFIGDIEGGSYICGISDTEATYEISDCANYGTLSQTVNNGTTGGVHSVGAFHATGTRLVTRCISDCTFSHSAGSSGTGGITSNFYRNTVQSSFVNNFWNSDKWATDFYSGTGNNEGLTESEMKDSGNFTNFDFDDVWFMLTSENIETVCGAGYGDLVYAALPANMKDKPWLRDLSDVLIEGITPSSGFDALFFGGGL